MCKYEVSRVDAWKYDDWEYNETFHLFDFNVRGHDDCRSLRQALNRHGIKLTRRCMVCSPDGFMLEVIVRKTQEPLFCAIPME